MSFVLTFQIEIDTENIKEARRENHLFAEYLWEMSNVVALQGDEPTEGTIQERY